LIAAAFAATSACAHAGQPAELAEIMRQNAADATADASNISREADPDARAAKCHVFLALSRNLNSRNVGHDDAAMRRAQGQWYGDLRSRMPKIEVDQLIASTGNILEPADPVARDAASRFCVDNAPTIAKPAVD
jgi:hypothetical protein